MRFSDKNKIAFKLITNHKSETLITSLVLLITNLVILFVVTIGISLIGNGKKDLIKNAQEENMSCQLYFDSVLKPGTIEMYKTCIEILKTDNIGIVCFDKYKYGVSFSNPPDDLEITNSIETNTTKTVYLNYDKSNKYHVGDTFTIKDEDFIIAGFIAEDSTYTAYNYLVNLDYVIENTNVDVISIHFSLYPENYNGISKICKDVNRIENKLEGKYASFSSDNEFYNKDLNFIKIFSILFYVLTFLLLVFMFSTVSNSICIIFDRNNHTYQMLDVLGISSQDKRMINLLQLFYLLFLTSIIAYGFILLMMSKIKLIVDEIMITFDGFLALRYEAANVTCSLPVYMPILIFCTSFVMLFLFNYLSTKRKRK